MTMTGSGPSGDKKRAHGYPARLAATSSPFYTTLPSPAQTASATNTKQKDEHRATMSSSWFYRLRRKRTAPIPKPPPPSPNTPDTRRASYYVPSRDRAVSPRPAKQDNPKRRDTRFPRSPQPGDIVFDVVARRDSGGPFKLRPIVTRRADASDSASSPTASARRRLHLRARDSSGGGKAVTDQPAEACKRRAGTVRWLYESVVLVKESAEPEEDFRASMEEMIAAHDVRSPRSLEALLARYLALNAAEHHRAIVAAFRRALLAPKERCHLHARCTPPI